MQEGCSCIVCHSIDQVDQRGNADYVLVPPQPYLWEHDTGWRKAVSNFLIRAYPRQHLADYDRPVLRSPEFCGVCHKQYIPEELNRFGVSDGQNQYDEWRNSHWNCSVPDQNLSCVDCHMRLVYDSTDPSRGEAGAIRRSPDDGAHRHHGTIATNFYMPQILELPGWEQHVAETQEWMRGETVIPETAHLWPEGPVASLELFAADTAVPGETVDVRAVVTNRKAGHNLTTGPLDFMQCWIHLRVSDADGRQLGEWGMLHPESRELMDEAGRVHQVGNSRREGTLVLEGMPVDRHGNLLRRHELWDKAGGKGGRTIFPNYSDSQLYVVPVPPDARGPLTVEADLNYRRYRQEFLDLVLPELEATYGPQPLVTKASARIRIALLNEGSHGCQPSAHDTGPGGGSSMIPRRLRLSRRQRSIWFSVLGTLAIVAALTVVLRMREIRYNTDLSDARAGITSYSTDFTDRQPAPEIRFRDVAAERGLHFHHGPAQRARRLCEDTGGGLAWADYDGSGYFDLYVVNYCRSDENGEVESIGGRLFRNQAGHFTDVTEAAGVANPAGRGMAASWADFDDDGFPDLYVTNFGGPNRLYRNQGDGTFREVAAEAGVADSIWSTGVCWGDFRPRWESRSVRVRLCRLRPARFVGRAVDSRAGPRFGRRPVCVEPQCLRSAAQPAVPQPRRWPLRRSGRSRGVANPQGRSFSATAVDLDGDGWLDLYVANDVSPNALFRNMTGQPDVAGDENGRLAFWDLSAMTGMADFRGSMGLSVAETGELTGAADGLPDLFYTNWLAQENGLYQSLQMPDGAIEYRDRARPVRLAEDSLEMVGWGCGFADLDLDGRDDLVIVNGSTLEQSPDRTRLIPQRMFVYWNDGRVFRNVAPACGAGNVRSVVCPWLGPGRLRRRRPDRSCHLGQSRSGAVAAQRDIDGKPRLEDPSERTIGSLLRRQSGSHRWWTQADPLVGRRRQLSERPRPRADLRPGPRAARG
jgi:enediyne biosynthesis protein E4